MLAWIILLVCPQQATNIEKRAVHKLFAVSLLPPIAVFVDALFNIAFIVAALTFLFPQNAELRVLLHTSALQDALARPIVIQVLVAVISYLWVNSATQAIARADRATTIAALERTMAEQAQVEAEQKHQLEASIQQIVEVHTRVANGDFSARVPLDQGNTLWEVAGALNNLLARIQRLRYEAQYRSLFEAAGLRLARVWPTRSSYSILEGIAG